VNFRDHAHVVGEQQLGRDGDQVAGQLVPNDEREPAAHRSRRDLDRTLDQLHSIGARAEPAHPDALVTEGLQHRIGPPRQLVGDEPRHDLHPVTAPGEPTSLQL
jgi:hypothetical protein